MATIHVIDMMNLFVEDEDPTKSQFLVLEEVKLPSFQEKTVEHMGGGALAGLKIGMRALEPLEFGFKLRGFNPDVINKFMTTPSVQRKYTALGNVRDIQTSLDYPAKIIVAGHMSKVDHGSFQRDSASETDYEISEVTHYEFYLNGVEKYYFNYFDGPLGWRVDGVPQFGNAARNLGLA